jgi:hypothetical protein
MSRDTQKAKVIRGSLLIKLILENMQIPRIDYVFKVEEYIVVDEIRTDIHWRDTAGYDCSLTHYGPLVDFLGWFDD